MHANCRTFLRWTGIPPYRACITTRRLDVLSFVHFLAHPLSHLLRNFLIRSPQPAPLSSTLNFLVLTSFVLFSIRTTHCIVSRVMRGTKTEEFPISMCSDVLPRLCLAACRLWIPQHKNRDVNLVLRRIKQRTRTKRRAATVSAVNVPSPAPPMRYGPFCRERA